MRRSPRPRRTSPPVAAVDLPAAPVVALVLVPARRRVAPPSSPGRPLASSGADRVSAGGGLGPASAFSGHPISGVVDIGSQRFSASGTLAGSPPGNLRPTCRHPNAWISTGRQVTSFRVFDPLERRGPDASSAGPVGAWCCANAAVRPSIARSSRRRWGCVVGCRTPRCARRVRRRAAPPTTTRRPHQRAAGRGGGRARTNCRRGWCRP